MLPAPCSNSLLAFLTSSCRTIRPNTLPQFKRSLRSGGNRRNSRQAWRNALARVQPIAEEISKQSTVFIKAVQSSFQARLELYPKLGQKGYAPHRSRLPAHSLVSV